MHQGVKPPECDYCKKTFIRKEDLARHVELHIGEKKFGCSACNKTVRIAHELPGALALITFI